MGEVLGGGSGKGENKRRTDTQINTNVYNDTEINTNVYSDTEINTNVYNDTQINTNLTANTRPWYPPEL